MRCPCSSCAQSWVCPLVRRPIVCRCCAAATAATHTRRKWLWTLLVCDGKRRRVRVGGEIGRLLLYGRIGVFAIDSCCTWPHVASQQPAVWDIFNNHKPLSCSLSRLLVSANLFIFALSAPRACPVMHTRTRTRTYTHSPTQQAWLRERKATRERTQCESECYCDSSPNLHSVRFVALSLGFSCAASFVTEPLLWFQLTKVPCAVRTSLCFDLLAKHARHIGRFASRVVSWVAA